MNQQRPLPPAVAATAIARCIGRSAVLLVRGKVHQPGTRVGHRLRFAGGSTSVIYRETVVERPPARDPVVLVVEFQLRGVRGRGHAVFRAESVLNTPLFVGFPGYVSKLWLAHDDHGVYRGIYQWDGARLAEDYARALWRVLALVSVRGSIHYQVLPGLRRDEVLEHPHMLDAVAASGPGEWWRSSGTA